MKEQARCAVIMAAEVQDTSRGKQMSHLIRVEVKVAVDDCLEQRVSCCKL